MFDITTTTTTTGAWRFLTRLLLFLDGGNATPSSCFGLLLLMLFVAVVGRISIVMHFGIRRLSLLGRIRCQIFPLEGLVGDIADPGRHEDESGQDNGLLWCTGIVAALLLLWL